MRCIGIVGNGYVGKATSLLKCNDVDVIIYDKIPSLCLPRGTTNSSFKNCDFVFVCVPTPMKPSGECDVSIVTQAVQDLVDTGYDRSRIIIRSTVPVGTCMRLGTMFCPEFLTERNWESDFRNSDKWVLGWDEASVDRSIVSEIYDKVFYPAFKCGALKLPPKVDYYSTQEAELAKYVRNCFLAVKVSFFNEIHSFCKYKNIDYDNMLEAVIADNRIGSSHTAVPGPDGKCGYGGTCFPKDTTSLQHQIKSLGLNSNILDASKYRNEYIDRPEKDWESAHGRAVV